MAIPSIPIPAPVSSIEQGTKIDPRSQLALIGQTADTVSTALGVISEYEQRKQKAEEVAGFNQASIVLNKATADYQHNLKTMPDKDIVPKWQEEAAKVKDSVMQNMSGWSQAAKRKMAQHLDTWASDSTIQFQVAGDHLASERRKATAVAAAHEFLQTGDPAFLENAKQAITVARDAGDFTATEASAHIGALQHGLEMNQVQINMEQDPFAMRDTLEAKDENGKYLNFTAIPASQRAPLIFRANKLSNETRVQTMREWTQMMADARNEGTAVPDRELLNPEAKRQGISPKFLDKLYAPPKPELDTAQYQKDVYELKHLDLVDDPTGKNLTRATEIQYGYKGAALKNLSDLVTEGQDPNSLTNKPTIKRAFKELDDLFDAGGFGNFKEPSTGYDELGNKLPPTVNAAKQTAAYAVYGQAASQLRQWAKDNPAKVNDDVAVSAQLKIITGNLAAKNAGIDLRNHLY